MRSRLYSQPAPFSRYVLARVSIGWSLLALAWAFANPPFAAPDEADHYVRVVGIADGHVVGAPAPEAKIGRDPAEVRFDKSTQRAVIVPARLDPSPFNCYLANPSLSAKCLNRAARTGPPARLITSVGTYPPLALLPAAAVVRSADDPLEADRLGRLATMPIAIALLIAAAIALFEPRDGWLSLVGILAACTPTAIFLMASLTPSGISISAAIALSAALVATARDRSPRPGVWILVGVSGAALALSHPTGLGWAVFLAGGYVAFVGVRTARRLVREQMPASVLGLAVFAIGASTAFAWHVVYGPSTPLATRGFRPALGDVPHQSWNLVRDLVAGFGYLEFRLPLSVYFLWFVFVGAIFFAAMTAGGQRARNAVLATGLLAFFVPVGVWLLFARGAGIGINGRQYMPFLVAVPIVLGEILRRHRGRLSRRATATVALLATIGALIQFVAWYLNGQRAAVGTRGSLIFVAQAGWTPPLGWPLWIAVAGCGAVILASVSVGSLITAVRDGSSGSGRRWRITSRLPSPRY